MRSISEHQRLKIIRCIILTLAVSFMLLVTLHHTSKALRDFMFSDPEDLVDWDDHIQIAVLLKGENFNIQIHTYSNNNFILEHNKFQFFGLMLFSRFLIHFASFIF